MTRPTVVLVHGAWVGPWEFEPVLTTLPALGIQVELVSLPSTGSTASLTDDADAIRAVIDRVGGPVVLVGHSYGGVPMTQAGVHPHVVRVVYVCAFVVDAGQSLQDAIGGFPSDWPVENGQISLGADREARADLIFADLPPGTPRDVAVMLADMFVPQSLAALTDKVTEVAWREKPSTYILGTRDAVVVPELQEHFARLTGGDVVRVPHGHLPFQEDPEGFAQLIERILAN